MKWVGRVLSLSSESHNGNDNIEKASSTKSFLCKVVCSHKYLSKCLERKKLRWRLKHGLRTDSLYNCELNKNELHMFFLIKRGEVIFFVSFKRIPYRYHPSVLNKTSDNDKITFTIQSNFKPPWSKELKHWLTCLWVWTAVQQHQCLLYHTLARCLCWTSSEVGFKHGSAVIGLIEVISCKFMLNWFSKAGPTEHVFKCSVSAHLLTMWKGCCKLNGVHHCRNSLQIGQELRQTLVLKPTLYLHVQLWGLGDFVCGSGRFLDSGCSWKNPLAGRAAELAGFSSAVLGQVVYLAVGQWELGEVVFQDWPIPFFFSFCDVSWQQHISSKSPDGSGRGGILPSVCGASETAVHKGETRRCLLPQEGVGMVLRCTKRFTIHPYWLCGPVCVICSLRRPVFRQRIWRKITTLGTQI